MSKEIYFNPTIGQIDFERVVEEIVKFINDDLNKQYRLIIGSDSEGKEEIEVVNAIVIHRLGHGGRYFWRKIYRNNIHNLRQKIYEEVNFSISTTLSLLKFLEQYKQTLSRCELEIHVDVGENGKTKEIIKEIVGMVKGYGFKVKTKPYAYGASNIADRHV